jgi:hypothetical protein
MESVKHDDTVFDDLWNDPPECSVDFSFWSVDENCAVLEAESVVAPVGIETLVHTEASWKFAESPCDISPPSIFTFCHCTVTFRRPKISYSSPLFVPQVLLSPNYWLSVRHCSTSSSLPRSTASSGYGTANSDDGNSAVCAPASQSPVSPQLMSDDAANALVPVVVSLVRATPASSIDSVTNTVNMSSPSVPREEIRRMTVTAVAMEQLQTSSLLHLTRWAMTLDPSKNAAFSKVRVELFKALARPP